MMRSKLAFSCPGVMSKPPSSHSGARFRGIGGLALLALLAGCGEETSSPEPPLRTVRHVTVTSEPGRRIRSFSGVSRAARQASLSFKVGGTISGLDAVVGGRVREGQIIARLDPSGFRLQLQQAEAEALRAEAERRNAAVNYERIKGLYETRSASRTELDAARAASESTNALVSAAARAVELAKLNLSYTSLGAGQGCSVVEVVADVGENVGAGQPVVEVNCGEHLEIAITVPETLIASFSPGLPGEITFDALPGRTLPGVVSEVGVAATGAAFPVTVRMEGTGEVRSGLAAQVDFAFERGESTMVLPAASVAEDERGRFVYMLVDGDEAGVGVIRRQPVEVGALTSQGLEVVSGVASGDRVVTAGISVIRDGMKVRVD